MPVKVRCVVGLFPSHTPIRRSGHEDVVLGMSMQYLLCTPHIAETDEPFAIIKNRNGSVCAIAESVLVDEDRFTNAVFRHFISQNLLLVQ